MGVCGSMVNQHSLSLSLSWLSLYFSVVSLLFVEFYNGGKLGPKALFTAMKNRQAIKLSQFSLLVLQILNQPIFVHSCLPACLARLSAYLYLPVNSFLDK